MAWRMAKSLDVLLAEIDALAPNRSTVSDGGIGDAAHASRTSDHNPWVRDRRGVGVVRARDFTHDPAGGLDGNWLASKLVALLGKHPALGTGAYVIWNRRIFSTERASEGWRSYDGDNPHEHHVHVSVGLRGYDSTRPWLARKPVIHRVVSLNMHQAKNARPFGRLVQRLRTRWGVGPDVVALQEARFAHVALRIKKRWRFVGGGHPVENEARAELVNMINRRCTILDRGYERSADADLSDGPKRPKAHDRGTRWSVHSKKGETVGVVNIHMGFTDEQIDSHMQTLRPILNDLEDRCDVVFVLGDANVGIDRLLRMLKQRGYQFNLRGSVDVVASTYPNFRGGVVSQVVTGSDHPAPTARAWKGLAR